MTEARTEPTEPDVWGAKAHLERARVFETAACDALLAITGYRVVGADGGHRLRLERAQDLLGGDHEDLFDRLDDARDSRNIASYSAVSVPLSDAEDAATATGELIELVEDRIRRSLPPWALDADG